MFPSPNGEPYSRAHISWVWRKAAKALLRREGQKYLTAEATESTREIRLKIRFDAY